MREAVVLWIVMGVVWLSAVPVDPAPIPLLLDHKNIIMTLHGLIEHADMPDIIAVDRTFAAQRTRAFYETYGEHKDSPAMAYASMDLDDDGRLKLSEAVLWTLAASHVLATSVNDTACAEFEQLAEGKAQLDPELVQAMRLVEYSDNAFDHFFQAIDADRDGLFSQEEYTLFRFPDYSQTLRNLFADQFLDSFDTDASNTLSLQEFLNGTMVIQSPDDSPYSAQSYDYRSERETVVHMFQDNLDQDRSGVLERDELADVLHPTHFSHSIHEAYAVFVQCDDNGDHELSPEEFSKCSATRPFLQRHSLSEVDMTKAVEDVYGRMGQRLRRLGLAHIRHDEL